MTKNDELIADRALRPKFVVNFWQRTVAARDNCIAWTGRLNVGGYGVVGARLRDGRATRMLAHRIAWHLFGNALDSTKCVMHTCDNPRCVNPNHLRVGTKGENTRDMIAKGRQKMGHNPPHGSRNWSAKLTDDIVRSIRASDERSSVIARRLGMSYSAVRRVKAGKTWKETP